jgi:LysM repeat protein
MEVEKRKGEWFIIHEVDQGETLYSLSRRYQSDVAKIVATNDIKDNQLSLHQRLFIPVEKDFAKYGKRLQARVDKLARVELQNDDVRVDSVSVIETDSLMVTPILDKSKGEVSTQHVVLPKETLYAVSRKYNVSLDDLRLWNTLESDALKIGQVLVIQENESQLASLEVNEQPETTTIGSDVLDKLSQAKKSIPFTTYFVQNGDIIETIASKFIVSPDSILFWNNLSNNYLAIGQKLQIKGEIDSLSQTIAPNTTKLPYGSQRKSIDESGFAKVFEEGIALIIDTPMQSDKALALHRTQPIGAMLEVRNLMNNKKILVKVVGKLPETGLNKNTLIRLTRVSFKRLGVIDPKARVEVSYYE